MDGPSRKLSLGMLALIVAILLAQLAATGSFSLFTRHFWLDEVHTYLTVADPSLAHALAGLKGTVNGAPPEYFLLLRLFSSAFGGAGEWTFRLFSFLMTTLALWGIYSLLRRAWSPLVALTATMAAWANPVLLRQTFEARYYALWLAAIVWFAWFLACEREGGTWRSRLLLAICAALACTTHYFGVAAIGLIVLGVLLFDRGSTFLRPRTLLALAAGPAALLARLPYYFSQKAALAHADHIPALNGGQVLRVVSELLPPTHIPLIALGAWVSYLLWRNQPETAVQDAQRNDQPLALAGLSALMAFPLLIVAFSMMVQPAFMSRYCLPAVAGFAVLFAFLMTRTAKPVVVSLLILFIALGAFGLLMFRRSAERTDRHTDAMIASLRALPDHAPVLFEISRDLSVISHYAPDLNARCFFMDFEEGEVGGVDKFRLSVRDMARIVERWYGSPALLSWTNTATQPEFYLAVGHRLEDDLAGAERDYPGFAATMAVPGILRMEAANRK